MKANRFDYIIIGNGLAGLQLALKFSEDEFFQSKSIALIDKSNKDINDKTWCYWEIGEGNWDHLVFKTWKKGNFHSSHKNIDLNLEPYSYKMIRSIDFYEYAKKIIGRNKHFTFINDNITDVQENDKIKAIGTKNTYSASMAFDSRIPIDYFNSKNDFLNIYQHFKGWIIETDSDSFDPDSFTMMDYRLTYAGDTTFTYVLPFSKRKALVEFTFFTPYKVEETIYDKYIKKYIKTILNIQNYQIIEEEFGVIPMTNFPFSKYSSSLVTKIGTAGGWVKSSTGYSFKHTEKKVEKLISNLKNNKVPSKGLINKKYAFYDSVLLRVLKEENNKGEWVFETFYSKNSAKSMFKFLDEETSFFEELGIMSSLLSWTFLKAFYKTL